MYRIAIVGRPNVGKSSLFNKLTGSRRAIVGNEPGMTRDRIYGLLHADGKEAEIVDTGGIVPEEKAVIPEQVLQQARTAMQESELILLVMDGRDGPTPLDASLVSIIVSLEENSGCS